MSCWSPPEDQQHCGEGARAILEMQREMEEAAANSSGSYLVLVFLEPNSLRIGVSFAVGTEPDDRSRPGRAQGHRMLAEMGETASRGRVSSF